MTLAMTALNQILIMFFIIIVGIICYKVKLIDKDTNKKLSDVVLMLVNPIVVFVSYQREFDIDLLRGLLITLILATVTHFLGIIISFILIRRKKQKENIPIERFAAIYSNCGFIGIPLVNGILGSEGVFYITAYITIFNLFIWTHGVITMTGKKDMKTLIRAILSPSIIATVTGFVFFVTSILLPNTVVDSLSYIGDMNTPLAMMVAGVTIAQTNILKLFGKIRIYYITSIKLLCIPIVLLFIITRFELPEMVMLTSVLAAACPTAATINLFALRYGKNYLYASELFTVTTILSIITIPIVMTIAGYFI